jgi:hypothetical protein
VAASRAWMPLLTSGATRVVRPCARVNHADPGTLGTTRGDADVCGLNQRAGESLRVPITVARAQQGVVVTTAPCHATITVDRVRDASPPTAGLGRPDLVSG